MTENEYKLFRTLSIKDDFSQLLEYINYMLHKYEWKIKQIVLAEGEIENTFQSLLSNSEIKPTLKYDIVLN
jgi:hypothetical protein